MPRRSMQPGVAVHPVVLTCFCFVFWGEIEGPIRLAGSGCEFVVTYLSSHLASQCLCLCLLCMPRCVATFRVLLLRLLSESDL